MSSPSDPFRTIAARSKLGKEPQASISAQRVETVEIPFVPNTPNLLYDLMRVRPSRTVPRVGIEHLRSIVSEAISKKVEVNAGREMPSIMTLAVGEGRKLQAA